MAFRRVSDDSVRFPTIVSLIFGIAAVLTVPAIAFAEDTVGEAVCAAVPDAQLAEDCWRRLFADECDSTAPDREACLAQLSARRADPSLVRRNNFGRRGNAIVTTSDPGNSDLEFTASFQAGPGSDVPPMYSEILMLTCRTGLSAVSIGLSRPPAASAVELFLDDSSFATRGWRQFGQILMVDGSEAERLIAALRASRTAAFTVVVSDDSSYRIVFDLTDSDAALWPLDYLCA